MKLVILVEEATPLELRQLADALWAGAKEDVALAPNVRDAMKALSSTLHVEASRLEKKSHG